MEQDTTKFLVVVLSAHQYTLGFPPLLAMTNLPPAM
jgi:hypothetical protein